MYYMYFSYIVARTKIKLIAGSRVKIQLEKIEERLGKAPRICNLINIKTELGKYYLAKLEPD